MIKTVFQSKTAGVVALAAMMTFMGGFCKGKSDGETLSVAGSDTIVQLSQSLAKAYTAAHPGKKISVSGGGSGTGIAALLNDTIDLANASRKMKEKEWKIAEEKGLVITEDVIALDMLAVVIHPDNPAAKLSIEQLSKIFTGAITNWKDVGGNDAPIVAISRENNSGTHVFFKEEVVRRGDKKSTAEYGDVITYAVSSQQIVDQVSSNPNAISYVGMGWLNDNVQAVSIKNDETGKFIGPIEAAGGVEGYPLARTLQVYINGKTAEKSAGFLDFIHSEEGKKVIIELGFLPPAK